MLDIENHGVLPDNRVYEIIRYLEDEGQDVCDYSFVTNTKRLYLVVKAIIQKRRAVVYCNKVKSNQAIFSVNIVLCLISVYEKDAPYLAKY